MPATALGRTNSTSSASSASSTSSSYSRTADDMLERILTHPHSTTVHLWSAGNLRLNGHDLTLPAREARELGQVLRSDPRFEHLAMVHLNSEGDEWKASYRLQQGIPSPATSTASELSASPW